MHIVKRFFSLLIAASWACSGPTTTSSAQQDEEPFCSAENQNDGTSTSCRAKPPPEDQQQDQEDSSCQDSHENCARWADTGECKNNSGWMKEHCRRSCHQCSSKMDGSLSSSSSSSSLKALDENKEKKQHYDGADMGTPQTLEADDLGVSVETIASLMQAARSYLSTTQAKVDSAVFAMCRNQHELCTIWAAMGECENNESYMKKDCAPACQSCDYLTVEGRCPIDPNAPQAWRPGDLDKTFRRLTAEPYLSKYQVQIMSSPDTTGGPWVLTMDHVVSKEEAKRLIDLGAAEGYNRSTDVGDIQPDGTTAAIVSTGRTSMNAWCQNECYEDEVAQSVIHRISNLTQINETNSEHLQLLKYEVGQYYHSHHDYIPLDKDRQQGVRILTVYLYLNDVEAGGGTNFPRLNNLTVMPKRGRVLIWPSVLDQKPHEIDRRTNHQALPVEAGLKYGANAWYHMFDFKTPNLNNCQ